MLDLVRLNINHIYKFLQLSKQKICHNLGSTCLELKRKRRASGSKVESHRQIAWIYPWDVTMYVMCDRKIAQDRKEMTRKSIPPSKLQGMDQH